MIGQGSPDQNGKTLQTYWQAFHGSFRLPVCVCALICAIFFPFSHSSNLTLLGQQRPLLAEQQFEKVRLRFSWGGSKSHLWKANISIDEGEFNDLVLLGLEVDQPGSIYKKENSIVVDSLSSRQYDAFDVEIAAPKDAKLTIKFEKVDRIDLANDTPALEDEIPLAQIVSNPIIRKLDSGQSRLHISRSPGDQLHVEFDRKNLVFDTGEKFKLSYIPRHVEIEPLSSWKCQLIVADVLSQKPVSNQLFDIKANELGQFPQLRGLELTVPTDESVYNVSIKLVHDTISSKISEAFATVLNRQFQIVAISKTPQRADWSRQESFHTIAEINPAEIAESKNDFGFPRIRILPNLMKNNRDRKKNRVETPAELSELPPGKWQTIPLKIARLNAPHILEIELPGDSPQVLGATILQPRDRNQVNSINIESGIVNVAPIGASILASQKEGIVHQIVFWPKIQQPTLVLSNTSKETTAKFGNIRILAGPKKLAPIFADTSQSVDTPLTPARITACCIAKPFIAESFSTPKFYESWANREIHDWRSFYLGVTRTIEYMKHVGYNTAFINVVAEGSSLYPSSTLQSSPRYDGGAFFVNGQDPVRKDVLDMMLRLFDREGIRLVPTIEFSSTLPAIETFRRDESSGAGLDLVGVTGTARKLSSSQGGVGFGGYNPLDPRVQNSMADVVQELVNQCQNHRCFKGVGIQLSQNSYTQMPGEFWGYDDKTIQSFAKQTGIEIGNEKENQYRIRQSLLSSKHRTKWLEWRSKRLTELYQKFATQLETQPDSKLYLMPTDIFETLEMSSALRPSLHSPTDRERALLKLGISASAIQAEKKMELLVAHSLVENRGLSQQRVDIASERSHRYGNSKGPTSGKLLFRMPSRNDLLHQNRIQDSVGFFSSNGLATSPISVYQTYARTSVFAGRLIASQIANSDTKILIDGGVLMPMGQNRHLKKSLTVFSQLPPMEFTEFKSSTTHSSVVARYASDSTRWYAYLVNDAPWESKVSISIANWNPTDQIISLADHRRVTPQGSSGAGRFTVTLKPYELFGLSTDNREIRITELSVSQSPEVPKYLKESVERLQALVRFQPEPDDKLLSNPSFEKLFVDKQRGTASWLHSKNSASQLERVADTAKEGNYCLRIKSSDRVSWLRSEAITPPETGRLSILVWMRIADEKKQPALRLCVEGTYGREEYYRFGQFGSIARGSAADPNSPSQLTTQWKPFAVHFDDIPPTGLNDLRVGIDVFGEAEIWVDKVQVFDRWFDENDRIALTQVLARAAHQLQIEKNFAGCQRTLESYWPRFLNEYSARETRTASLPKDNQKPRIDNFNVLQRMREIVPRNILPQER